MTPNQPSIAPSLALEFLKQAPLALVATTAAGHILLASRGAQLLFGRDPDDLHGRPFDDLLTEPSRPVRAALWEQYRAAPAPREGIRLHGLRSDGSEIGLWLSLSHASADGETVLLASLQPDPPVAEVPVPQPPSALAPLMHALPAGMHVSGLSSDLPVLFVSDGIRDQVGHDPAEFQVVPDFWQDHVHPEDRARLFSEIERDIPSGRGTYEYRFQHRSGEYRWVQDLVRFVRNADGAPTWAVGCMLDITERKAAEQALAAAEGRNRALLMAIPDMIFVARRDGQVVDYKVAPSQMPFPLDRLIGSNLRDIYLPPEVVDRYLALFAQVLDSGEGAVMEYAMDLQGKLHYREARITQCSPDEVLIIVRDITDRTRTEQRVRELNQRLAQQNRELEAFSYSVSHDLRAPLRAIDGFSYFLEERYGNDLDEKGQSYLQRIRSSVQRMSQLIDDLLALSRIASSAVKREHVDLSALAAEILDDLRTAAPDRHVTVAIAPHVLGFGDRRLLRILLDNLLSNAWKYTASRDQAHIALGIEERDGGPVYLVRDNGVGFDMQHADRLFRPFQRLHSNPAFPGTGIGLATAARIVDRHGGRIWAEAALDQGATFYFTLPGAPHHTR